MLKAIEGLDPDVVAFEGTGTVTAEDYAEHMVPAVEDALERHGHARCLYVLGDAFERFSLGAVWADTKIGLAHLTDFERIAVVTSHDWVRHTVHAFGALMPCPVRVFGMGDLADAKAWVSERRVDGFTLDITRSGDVAVIHACLQGKLDHDAEDALVRAANEGIGDADEARVLVEAEDFHGWRDLRALWRHVRFIAGKRAVIERVAIVGDAKWQRRLVATAKHILRVDARFFEVAKLGEAEAWIRG